MRLMHWIRLIATRGLGGIAGLLATMAATRLLGTHEAGLLFLALAVVTVVTGISRLGLDTPLVRFIGAQANAADRTTVNGVFRLALTWVLATSLCTGTALFLLRYPLSERVFSQPRLAELFTWMAWLVPVTAMYWLHAQAFVGIRKPEFATAIQNIFLPAGFVLLLLALAAQSPPDGVTAAGCYLAAGLVTLTIAMSLWWRQPWARQPGHFDAQYLWRTARPVWAAVFANLTIQWGGQLTAGAMLQPADVAHLAAAQRTAMLISLALAITNMMISPRFAQLHHQGESAALRQLAQRASRLLFLVATPAALAVALAAPLIMSLFGEGFTDSALLLVILVVGQWINAITGSVGMLLTMTGHERDLRNIMLATAVIALLLFVGLTQAFGVLGTALAIALAMAIQNIGNMLVVKRRLGFLTLG